jgi:hypothetical protein
MLTVEELRSWEKWKNKSPEFIRQSVISAGGWSRVFPMKMLTKLEYPEISIGPFKEKAPVPIPKFQMLNEFPLWASRVRNYFNEEPRSLRLLSKEEGKFRIHTIKDRIMPWVPGPQTFALSGDVYEDDNRRHWFAMSTGGTVYHYPGCVDKTKIALAAASPQSMIPIFKLISPDDGTGGSLEVIVFNKQDIRVPLPSGHYMMIGRPTIGSVGVMKNLDGMVERDAIFRGSYNFSETMVAGYLDHEFRDVKPHVAHKDFYLNPDYSRPANKRVFPPVDLTWYKVAEQAC